MKLDLIEYDREVYTSLDWFGNLGGLSEGLKIMFSLFIGVLNFQAYNAYMVAALFNVSETKEDHERGLTKSNTTAMQKAFRKRFAKDINKNSGDPRRVSSCV